MSHGPCDFKKRNLKAGVQAVREAGLEVARVEIEANGKITIITGKPDDPVKPDDKVSNPWDEVLDHAQDKKRPS